MRRCSGPDGPGSGENLWLCDDGVDNDGDGFVDWPADEGCLDVFPGWKEDPQCWDGVDNDGDGDIDYDAGGNGDAQCSSKYDDREANGCGIGFEIALVLVPLLVARRRRGRARRVVRIER